MSDLSTILEQSSALHKHLCPRQVLGARIGMYAAELFELELPQTGKRLFAFVETDGCFADGISTATGCWFGHRTLRLMDYGKVAATFIDTRINRAIRIWPNPHARDRAARYASDARSRWHMYLAAYEVMPAAELLLAEEVALSINLAALISRPGVRVNCAVCCEEIINEREVCREGEILCRSCAGERYYERADEPTVLLNNALSLDGQSLNGAVRISSPVYDRV
jgi:formylmethanofuran dehydrogenase subunit E